MAQGVCWVARDLGVPAAVVAPDHAPRAKLDAIERLGGRVISVPFDTWWRRWNRGSTPGSRALRPPGARRAGHCRERGHRSRARRAARRIRHGARPVGRRRLDGDRERARGGSARRPRRGVRAGDRRPATASLAAGRSVGVDYTPSFVDGAGSKALLADVGPRAVALAGAVALPRRRRAIRLLATRASGHREGAGALAAAPSPGTAAPAGSCASFRRNIDPDRLARILVGRCRRRSYSAGDGLGHAEVHPLERGARSRRGTRVVDIDLHDADARTALEDPVDPRRSCSSATRRRPCPSCGSVTRDRLSSPPARTVLRRRRRRRREASCRAACGASSRPVRLEVTTRVSAMPPPTRA